MDNSPAPGVCFYCWREKQVKIKLDKWLNANPIYKPIDTDTDELRLLKEITINAKESNFRQQMQPQPREQSEYNMFLATYDCFIKNANSNNIDIGSVRPQMVDFGSEQGLNGFQTAGIACAMLRI